MKKNIPTKFGDIRKMRTDESGGRADQADRWIKRMDKSGGEMDQADGQIRRRDG